MSNYQSGNYDFFTPGQSQDAGLATKSARERKNELRITPVSGSDGKQIAGVLQWEIIINTLASGFGHVWDTARSSTLYSAYMDRIIASTLVTDFPGSVTLPMISSVDTVKHSGTTVNVTTSCEIYGVQVVGNGGTANQCLAIGNAGTGFVQVTYSPGSAITELKPVIIGGVGTAQQLFVGKAGAAAQILSDVTVGGPTSAGTMHANTTCCTGVITSPLNSATPGAGTLMMLANQGLYLQGTETAIGAAPTAALTNVPRGGYWAGIVRIPGTPQRAYAVLPDQDAGAQSMFVNTQRAGKLVSFNLEGTDPQDVRLDMPRVLWAFQWGDSIVCSDGFNMFQIDSTVHDLHLVSAFEKNFSTVYQIMGGVVINGLLHAWVVKNDLITAANTTMCLMRYRAETNSWSQTSADITLTNSAACTGSMAYMVNFYVQPSVPQLSWSPGGYATMPKLGTTNYYVHQFQTLPGYEPFYQYNTTTADIAAGNGFFMETTGSVTSTAMNIDGYEGYPAIVEEIVFMGNVAAGGTGASVKIDIAEQVGGNSFNFSNNRSATFIATDNGMISKSATGEVGANWVRWATNKDPFTRLRWKETLTQGSDGRQTPNGLPMLMRGLLFTDRRIRSPLDVRGY